MDPSFKPSRPGPIAVAALYLVYAALIGRTLDSGIPASRFPIYVGLFLLHMLLATGVLVRPDIDRVLLHAYLASESCIALLLLALDPRLDFITALFVILAYQGAHLWRGRTRWLWVTFLVLIIPASLVFYLGPLQGLALSLVPAAMAIASSAQVRVSQETEAARLESQAMLHDLQANHAQLEEYSHQAAELATLEERNRLARELHDTVSQTLFSIMLTTRSAQILLGRDPSRVRSQLVHLQDLSQNALAQMRTLIAELRPKNV